MKVYKIIKSNLNETEKIQQIMQILNILYPENINEVLKYIFDKRFPGTKSKESVILFDYLIDFDLIYALFLKEYRIDLIKEDIGWWQFTAMFEELTLNDNALTKRIGYRAYKVPIKRTKGDEEQVKHYMNMKLKYQIKDKNVDYQLGRMFKSLEKR